MSIINISNCTLKSCPSPEKKKMYYTSHKVGLAKWVKLAQALLSSQSVPLKKKAEINVTLVSKTEGFLLLFNGYIELIKNIP